MIRVFNEKLKKENKKIKVLYVAGPTRSGSTIISNILGQINGFFHAGEIIEAWDRGQTWKCSCGCYPQECVVWSDIFKALTSAIAPKDLIEIIRARDKLSRSHKVVLHHYWHPRKAMQDGSATHYVDGLTTLYALIQTKTGANVIVDSSKNVGYCDTLSRVPAIDLYVLHLVRDSRATVFSWSKKKEGLWKANPFKKALEWSSRNCSAEFLKKRDPHKYIKIRYEDFIKNPQQVVYSVLHLLRIAEAQLPFISANEVMIETSHGLCGNPGRFHHGVQKIVMDDRWKKMKRSDNLMATFLTWPLLLKYKYQLY